MAKVKPNLKSDEDSAVELSKSASDSDQSPREDLFSEIDIKLPTFYASDDSEMTDDDVSSSAVSSSTYHAPLSFASNRISVSQSGKAANFQNIRRSTRKGRKRSIEDDETLLEQELSQASYKHQSKNAINARINRIKKKKYMQTLEDSLNAYKSECKKWQLEYRQKVNEARTLQNEVKYLKSVIRNETRLGKLVKSLSQRVGAEQPSSKVNHCSFQPFLDDKGTNLSCLNLDPFTLGSNNRNDIFASEFLSDINMNNIPCTDDFLNSDSESLGSDFNPISNEDMTFKSVFPSACDLLNSDLPEIIKESGLYSPELPFEPSEELDAMSSLHDDVGICLHVSANNGISMEFCSHCSGSTFSEFADVSLMD